MSTQHKTGPTVNSSDRMVPQRNKLGIGSHSPRCIHSSDSRFRCYHWLQWIQVIVWSHKEMINKTSIPFSESSQIRSTLCQNLIICNWFPFFLYEAYFHLNQNLKFGCSKIFVFGMPLSVIVLIFVANHWTSARLLIPDGRDKNNPNFSSSFLAFFLHFGPTGHLFVRLANPARQWLFL